MSQTNQIRGLTFDLWQTLILDDPASGGLRMNGRLQQIHQILNATGFVISEAQLRRGYSKCIETCQGIRSRSLDVSFEEQIRIFINSIDECIFDSLPCEVIDLITNCYADAFWESPPNVHPDAGRILGEVRDMGYKIGLISNTAMTPGYVFRDFMKKANIIEFFDALIFSDETGCSKPSKDMFLMTATVMGMDPKHIIHIGDDFLNDVSGAQQAGMRAIWIADEKERVGFLEPKPDGIISSLGQLVPIIRKVSG